MTWTQTLDRLAIRVVALSLCVFLPGCTDSVAGENASLDPKFDVEHFTGEDGLAWSQVAAVAVCPNGDVWFGYGIGGNGITRFDGSRWETLTREDGLAKNSVYALACDRSGVLWIGYWINAGGLTRYDGKRWTTFTKEDGLSNDRIASIGIGPDGEIWIGFGNQANGIDRLK